MSVRTCEHDQSQARYVCKTHNVYFCELHYRQHISDRKKDHDSFPIDNALAQPEFEQLQTEVAQRINTLVLAKQQVASQAAQLIAMIEQACFERIVNLDTLIQTFRTHTTENNFDHQTLQNITKLLTSRLKIQIDQDLTLHFRKSL
jgi:hypothetical protein